MRTNKEGIFPRAWVNVIQDKDAPAPTTATNYGNMPLEVSQSGSAPPGPEGDGKGNKFEQHGKKFGKKMGNAGMLLRNSPNAALSIHRANSLLS